jgi:hypothetical protein
MYFIQLATHFSASKFLSICRSNISGSVSPREHVDGATLCGVDDLYQ